MDHSRHHTNPADCTLSCYGACGDARARLDGIDAALRQGRYEGVLEVPDNPHIPDTMRAGVWEKGFSAGTDALVEHNRRS